MLQPYLFQLVEAECMALLVLNLEFPGKAAVAIHNKGNVARYRALLQDGSARFSEDIARRPHWNNLAEIQ